MIVYLDVLIVLNFYIMYFLIRAVCVFTHQSIKAPRLLLGSGIGSLTALAILLPNPGFWFILLVKLLSSLVIILTTFGFQSVKNFIKQAILFLLMNVIFAGIMLLIEQQLTPNNMIVSNGVFYLDISIVIIILSTIIAYFAIKLITYLIDNKLNSTRKFTIKITTTKGEKDFNALADTGNKLIDSFTGLPVILCSYAHIRGISPNEIIDFVDNNAVCNFSKGIKLIPANSIGGKSLIPAFKADCVTISYDNSVKNVNVLVGISESDSLNSDYNCIFNPILIR